jgi:hypothetical protein
MTGFGNRLMVTAKEGPGHDVSVGNHLLPDQGADQAQHFWQGVGDQLTANPLRRLKFSRLLWP